MGTPGHCARAFFFTVCFCLPRLKSEIYRIPTLQPLKSAFTSIEQKTFYEGADLFRKLRLG